MARAAKGRSRRDIVVIGASAGGVEALVQIVRGLAPSFDAAVFVVLHLAEGATTALPQILDRTGALPAVLATGSRPVQAGTITIAPPDHHLVLEAGCVRAIAGPKVDGYRPAIDALFQSAARVYGPRVVGVVLSGSLDDGTSGLAAIKRRSGVALVQADPTHAGMPSSAVENVDVDAILPIEEIPKALTMLLETNTIDVTGHDPLPESDLEAGFATRQGKTPAGTHRRQAQVG